MFDAHTYLRRHKNAHFIQYFLTDDSILLEPRKIKSGDFFLLNIMDNPK